MENQWLSYAKRLHALATSGLEFTGSDYDRDRYREIQTISQHMLTELAQAPLEQIQSIMLAHVKGYETPKIDVRAALIKNDQILLVQEKTDQRWALPGGYADVGLSAAENAVKETMEEAGVAVRVKLFYSMRHKAKGEYRADVRDFYKLFFLCEADEPYEVAAGSEVLAADFFSLDKLPPLSEGRTVKSDLQAALNAHHFGIAQTYFDPA